MGACSCYEPGDSLAFTIFDRDPGKKDDLLGRAVLNSEDVWAGFEGSLALSDAGQGRKASLYVKVSGVTQQVDMHGTTTVDLRKDQGNAEVAATVQRTESPVLLLQDPRVKKWLETAISHSLADFCAGRPTSPTASNIKETH